MKNKNISCPKCKGENVIRKGRQNTKFGFVQLFYCKDCQRKFAGRGLKNKTYGHGVIMNTINYYNIGNTLEESARHINRRFKVNVTKSSVHRWVMEFKNICTYYKFRAMVLKNYGKEIIFGKTFEHRGLAYNFKYHKGKLDILCNSNELSSLREYINRFESGCPIRFFEEDERCSQLMINIKNKREEKYNNACKLADFALKSCKSNRERHSVVENFMLINDSSTIACEVPVWLWEKNLNIGICGHIDILQIRNGKIYILDFKPDNLTSFGYFKNKF